MLENLVQKYSVKYASKYLVLAIDLVVVAISFFIALSVLDGFRGYTIQLDVLFPQIGVAVFLYAISSQVFKAHYGVIRHTSIADAKRVLFSVTLAVVLLKLASIYVSFGKYNYYFIPNSVIVLHYLISLTQLIIARFVFKFVVFDRRTISDIRNVMIFGAGSMGLITKHTIENDTLSNLHVVGFLDDNEGKTKKSIEGIQIYNTGYLAKLLREKEVKEVIIGILNLPSSRKRELVDICLENNIEIKTVPSIDSWINGELSSKQIKGVRIEDLLGRESIKLKKEFVQNELVGKCVLVTGAAGSIGSEIARQVLTYAPTKVLLLDQSESGVYDITNELLLENGLTEVISIVADVTQKERVEKVFIEFKPDYVFHAAAYKHVPLMENNPFEAVECNVKGTINLADLSAQYKVDKFVMISTDKAVNPTNVMGTTKRISEMYVQSLNNHLFEKGDGNTHFITTRFGNVLGSNGSVIPLFKNQIERGGPVLVTHPDITRYFMTIPEACQLVLEAGVMGKGGEIFIFDMGKSMKIIDLAKKMIQLSGLELGVDIEIKFTGLRQGEKLYEELLNDQEFTKPTHHQKIMIAKVRQVDYTQMRQCTLELFDLIGTDDDMKLVAKMKKIVPEFISNASKYEVLDKKD